MKKLDYRQVLSHRRSELLGSLDEMRFDTIAQMGRVAEEDQAQLSHDEHISLSRNVMDYENLRMVNEALDRLGTGEYGICQACDQPISEKRLKAVPWTRYCIVCQDQVSADGTHSSRYA